MVFFSSNYSYRALNKVNDNNNDDMYMENCDLVDRELKKTKDLKEKVNCKDI